MQLRMLRTTRRSSGLLRSTAVMAKGAPGYTDILLLGKTGMGKSSAGNKLLGLNGDGSSGDMSTSVLKVWSLERDGKTGRGNSLSEHKLSGTACPYALNDDGSSSSSEDNFEYLSTPCGRQSPESPKEQEMTALGQGVARYWKCVADEEYAPFFRTGAGAKSITVCPKVISNEVTRLRVCDTQGFAQSGGSTSVILANLELIRQVLIYQQEFMLQFQCVLYFLPCRGAPERADGVLTNEIGVLHHYFSNSIWERTVIAVTVPRRYQTIEQYTEEYGDPVKDSKEALSESLRIVVQRYKENINIEDINIVFLAQNIDCSGLQDLVGKPKAVGTLSVRKDICLKCSGLISFKIGHESSDDTETDSIPLVAVGLDPALPQRNTCHPRFRRKWSTFWLQERCDHCNALPGARLGCLPVGHVHKRKVVVKHETSQPMDTPLPVMQ